MLTRRSTRIPRQLHASTSAHTLSYKVARDCSRGTTHTPTMNYNEIDIKFTDCRARKQPQIRPGNQAKGMVAIAQRHHPPKQAQAIHKAKANTAQATPCTRLHLGMPTGTQGTGENNSMAR